MILAAVLLAVGTAWGDDAVPPVINYQGKLLNSQGDPATNGSYVVEFRVWSDPTDTDTSKLLWGRKYPIYVVNGLFSSLLGEGGQAVSPAPLHANVVDAFASSIVCYMGLTVTDDPQGPVASPEEILPRQRMVSAPFAFTAENAKDLLSPTEIKADAGQNSVLRFSSGGAVTAKLYKNTDDKLIFYSENDSARYGSFHSDGLAVPTGLQIRRLVGSPIDGDRAYLWLTENADGSSNLKLANENDENDIVEIANAKGSIRIKNYYEGGAGQNISLDSVDDVVLEADDSVVANAGVSIDMDATYDIGMDVGRDVILNPGRDAVARANDDIILEADDNIKVMSLNNLWLQNTNQDVMVRLHNVPGNEFIKIIAPDYVYLQSTDLVKIETTGTGPDDCTEIRGKVSMFGPLENKGTLTAASTYIEETAATDGFVIVEVHNAHAQTTFGIIQQPHPVDVEAEPDGADDDSGSYPVAKGETWKVLAQGMGSGGHVKVYWRPVGL